MRILIAEDEIPTAKAIKVLLEKACISVDAVFNGTDAWDYINNTQYDVVVLDIMMPGMSGLEVLEKMRQSRMSTPALMLTAKAEIEDRVAGLEAGADDYLPKPFATNELIARIRALGRRSASYTESVLRAGNAELNENRYEIRCGEKTVSLTNKEYRLLELFIRHPGFVFSTEHLMEKIWGYDTESEVDVVWTHIGYVRKKLKNIGADIEIKTIRGAGYSLEVEHDA